MNNRHLDRSTATEFLNRLATVWAKYRELGDMIPQRAAREGPDSEYVRSLLIDPNISQGALAMEMDFTGVTATRILTVTEDEVTFLDESDWPTFAKIDCSGAEFKLMSLQIQCPGCFADRSMQPCDLCDDTGKV
jgi:hypothetical protein